MLTLRAQTASSEGNLLPRVAEWSGGSRNRSSTALSRDECMTTWRLVLWLIARSKAKSEGSSWSIADGIVTQTRAKFVFPDRTHVVLDYATRQIALNGPGVDTSISFARAAGERQPQPAVKPTVTVKTKPTGKARRARTSEFDDDEPTQVTWPPSPPKPQVAVVKTKEPVLLRAHASQQKPLPVRGKFFWRGKWRW